MPALPKTHLTVEDYMEHYAAARVGRHELVNGTVVPVAEEPIAHNMIKGNLFFALREAVKTAQVDCKVHPDGATIKINSHTAREADCALELHPRRDYFSKLAEKPLAVFEVVSDTSRVQDMQQKAREYFSVDSIVHYVVIDPAKHLVLHHTRSDGDHVLTKIIREGALAIEEAGVSVAVADIFGEVKQ
jgi:Uma2 family endonuclease